MKFHKIYLELSDICHLQCSFCSPKKAQRGLMPLALFDSIASQIKHKTTLVSLHILGDPLCVSNLGDYLDNMESKNIRLDIVSSGIFLRREHFKLLCRKNIHQISFSLDSFFDRNNQKKLIPILENNHTKNQALCRDIINKELSHMSFKTPTNDTMEALDNKNKLYEILYLEKIFEFYEYLSAQRLKIYINLRLFGNYDYSYILQRYKNYEIQEKKRRIRLDKYFFLRFHTQFQWLKLRKLKSDSHVATHFFQTTKKTHTLQGLNVTYTNPQNFVAQRQEQLRHNSPYCLGGISQLGILSNGIVVPCCIDTQGYMQLGDLRIQTLQEILESELFLNFQYAQKNHINIPPMCKKCNFRGI
ncbi:radical SAM/SPASM domain-containing protein [Helicobacter didelphidarum]|uniref:Radical SAM/SPASM domain-containing protein n=1 Tax=Helicobacter didelphidarum TaxID=2040648 RepID=A0A3D8IL79_9HELI|nr:radical SAM/SPASM domain-containing protein [Helicobacter didelphidarum]RDU65321.1 radical SAM/SPASM domain-containing protein [Helicobacter didelphidarum]